MKQLFFLVLALVVNSLMVNSLVVNSLAINYLTIESLVSSLLVGSLLTPKNNINCIKCKHFIKEIYSKTNKIIKNN